MNLFRTKSLEQIRAGAEQSAGLRRTLTARDLVFLGVGATIGAGILSALGTGLAGGFDSTFGVGRPAAGPALIVSFLLTAIACAFTALCYAEFASMVPASGSAYTYTYATMGELMAWIIGWDLLLEYAVSNVAVAISWGSYMDNLLQGLGISLPRWLGMDPRTMLFPTEAFAATH
jgi:APA family basic amino acid/polyamine antiporter